MAKNKDYNVVPSEITVDEPVLSSPPAVSEKNNSLNRFIPDDSREQFTSGIGDGIVVGSQRELDNKAAMSSINQFKKQAETKQALDKVIVGKTKEAVGKVAKRRDYFDTVKDLPEEAWQNPTFISQSESIFQKPIQQIRLDVEAQRKELNKKPEWLQGISNFVDQFVQLTGRGIEQFAKANATNPRNPLAGMGQELLKKEAISAASALKEDERAYESKVAEKKAASDKFKTVMTSTMPLIKSVLEDGNVEQANKMLSDLQRQSPEMEEMLLSIPDGTIMKQGKDVNDTYVGIKVKNEDGTGGKLVTKLQSEWYADSKAGKSPDIYNVGSDLGSYEAKKEIDKRAKMKDILEIGDKFLKRGTVADTMESFSIIDQLNGLKSEVLKGNKTSINAMRNKIVRLFEKGVLTDQDIDRFSGNPSYAGQLKRWHSVKFKGTLPEDDLGDLYGIISGMEDGLQETFSKQFSSETKRIKALEGDYELFAKSVSPYLEASGIKYIPYSTSLEGKDGKNYLYIGGNPKNKASWEAR